VVIHSVKFAGAAVEGDSAAVRGPFTPNPSITTGAGDHFNGGFSTALVGEFPLAEALICGVATSGWYVRHGGPSPDLPNILTLLEQWEKGELSD
jgi:sugar/nucleoside kinase (ribokinase family)